MPNGNQITAQAADGTIHAFPTGTDPTVIDRVMKQYATEQQQTGFAARRAAKVGVSPSLQKQGLYEGTVGEVGRSLTNFADYMRGGTEDIQRRELAKVATGGPRTPIRTGAQIATGGAISDVSSVLGNLLRDPKQLGLAIASLIPVLRIPTGAIVAGESLGDVGNVARGGLTPENIQRGLFDLAGITGGIGAAGSGVGDIRANVRGVTQEVMGVGASKARVLADQHVHALATKQHLSGVADAVHADAQSAMSQVLAKVDEANPSGAFSKADIQAKVGDAVGDLVKVPERLPSSVAKILKVEKATGLTGPGSAEVGNFVNRLRSQGLSDTDVTQTLRGQGFSETEIRAATGAGAPTDSLTAEQLKQMRSDVGQELSRYGSKGTVGAALKKVYGTLSQELRGAAAKAGVESEWLDANNRYSQYAKDFTRKGSPIARVLGGSTASGIMEPLTGATRQTVIDLLDKYRNAGFDVDTTRIQEEMRRYEVGKTVTGLSRPTKMDLLMAGFAPKALAIRQLGPRLLRNPKAIGAVAGEGFDVSTLPPKQVYPSKAAAMKAKRP